MLLACKQCQARFPHKKKAQFWPTAFRVPWISGSDCTAKRARDNVSNSMVAGRAGCAADGDPISAV
jgi:hypothetical protein